MHISQRQLSVAIPLSLPILLCIWKLLGRFDNNKSLPLLRYFATTSCCRSLTINPKPQACFDNSIVVAIHRSFLQRRAVANVWFQPQSPSCYSNDYLLPKSVPCLDYLTRFGNDFMVAVIWAIFTPYTSPNHYHSCTSLLVYLKDIHQHTYHIQPSNPKRYIKVFNPFTKT